jgi:hypothetical protein
MATLALVAIASPITVHVLCMPHTAGGKAKALRQVLTELQIEHKNLVDELLPAIEAQSEKLAPELRPDDTEYKRHVLERRSILLSM